MTESKDPGNQIAPEWRSRLDGNCPICGTSDYDWGYIRGHFELTYSDAPTPVLAQALGLGSHTVRARRCQGCWNLQLFPEDAATPKQ
jgi:hypothetical protein